jgi:dimethylargininase
MFRNAIVCSPCPRRDEITDMREVLTEYYRNIEEINLPATLESGDVMMVGSHYFIGISHRTNSEGADQLINILKKFGLTGSKVPLKKMLHLIVLNVSEFRKIDGGLSCLSLRF